MGIDEVGKKKRQEQQELVQRYQEYQDYLDSLEGEKAEKGEFKGKTVTLISQQQNTKVSTVFDRFKLDH